MNDLRNEPTIIKATVKMVVRKRNLWTFASYIGESDPIYSDVERARGAGLPDLPVPAAFLTSPLHVPVAIIDWVLGNDLDPGDIRRGEQLFRYHTLAFAGDQLMFEAVQLPTRTSGVATEHRREMVVTRGGDLIATLRTSTVVGPIRLE